MAQTEIEALGPLLLRIVERTGCSVIESYLGTDDAAINRSGAVA